MLPYLRCSRRRASHLYGTCMVRYGIVWYGITNAHSAINSAHHTATKNTSKYNYPQCMLGDTVPIRTRTWTPRPPATPEEFYHTILYDDIPWACYRWHNQWLRLVLAIPHHTIPYRTAPHRTAPHHTHTHTHTWPARCKETFCSPLAPLLFAQTRPAKCVWGGGDTKSIVWTLYNVFSENPILTHIFIKVAPKMHFVCRKIILLFIFRQPSRWFGPTILDFHKRVLGTQILPK